MCFCFVVFVVVCLFLCICGNSIQSKKCTCFAHSMNHVFILNSMTYLILVSLFV